MNWENQSEAECASGMDAALEAEKARLSPVPVHALVGQEEDDENVVCRGCHRYWRAVRKSGYCDECEDAIREDIEGGKREERRLSNAEGQPSAERR